VLKNTLAADHGAVTANRVVGMLRTMFNKRGEIFDLPAGFNPAAKVEALPEHPRERVLSPEELEAFHKALDAHPDPMVQAISPPGTSHRGEEKQSAADALEDISLKRGEWSLPGMVTKNGFALEVAAGAGGRRDPRDSAG